MTYSLAFPAFFFAINLILLIGAYIMDIYILEVISTTTSSIGFLILIYLFYENYQKSKEIIPELYRISFR